MIFAYHCDINTKKSFQLSLELLKTHMKLNVFAKKCLQSSLLRYWKKLILHKKINFFKKTALEIFTAPKCVKLTMLLFNLVR